MHNLEQVSKIRSLGMWLDSRLTWKEHKGMEDKCKKVENIIRCVASKTIYDDFCSDLTKAHQFTISNKLEYIELLNVA